MTTLPVSSPRSPLDLAVVAARLPKIRSGASRTSLTIGLVIVGGVFALAVLAPLLPLADPYQQDYANLMAPPSLAHPFGTDQLGRDILSRVIYGGRYDIVFGLVTTALSMVLGMALGTAAGLFLGPVGAVIMRLVDSLMALPFVIILLAVAAILGGGLIAVFVGALVVSWVYYARITYAEMTVLRERQFILAARTLGYSMPRIVFRHALPNLLRPNLAFSLSDVVGNILALATLSYLGVGIKPPAPEWGAMIAGGQSLLLSAWWITTMPGLVVVAVGIGFTLIGEWMSERFSATGSTSA